MRAGVVAEAQDVARAGGAGGGGGAPFEEVLEAERVGLDATVPAGEERDHQQHRARLP